MIIENEQSIFYVEYANPKSYNPGSFAPKPQGLYVIASTPAEAAEKGNEYLKYMRFAKNISVLDEYGDLTPEAKQEKEETMAIVNVRIVTSEFVR